MSLELIVLTVICIPVVIVLAILIYRRIPKRLKVDKFFAEWKQLQAFCRDKKTWPNALQEADNLLDKALKKRKYKGKSMGERMVSAQRDFSDNELLWFAHNLTKKSLANPKIRLKEADVKEALLGFRNALRDVGALKTAEQARADQNAEGKK